MKTFLILQMFICTIYAASRLEAEDDSIFLVNITNYCDLRCGNVIHTLCEINTIEFDKEACGNITVYNMEGKDGATKYSHEVIVEGFNGIRNRIAERMNVSNMIKVKYDKHLAKMAKKILLRCKKTLTKDKCTRFGEENPMKRDYSTVVMTSFSQKTHVLHPKFIQFIFSTWYAEKNFMERPSFPPDDNPDVPDENGAISIHNNFTYMAHPDIEKVGCQLISLDGIFQFVCVLWPYVGNRFVYKNGYPARNCPNEYPVKDIIFESLCYEFSRGVPCYYNSLLYVAILCLLAFGNIR